MNYMCKFIFTSYMSVKHISMNYMQKYIFMLYIYMYKYIYIDEIHA